VDRQLEVAVQGECRMPWERPEVQRAALDALQRAIDAMREWPSMANQRRLERALEAVVGATGARRKQ